MRKQVRIFLVLALGIMASEGHAEFDNGTHSLNPLLLKREGDLHSFESPLPLLFPREGGRGDEFKSVATLMNLNCIDTLENTPLTPLKGGISDSSKSKSSTKTILFFGNSLTAGFGLEPSQAFPALIQQKIDTLKLPYQIINAGLSGETSAGGLRRINWLLNRKIDILVLELGANDGLRGIALEDTRSNLQEIITRTKKKNPQARIVLAGMMVPPNLGVEYRRQFQRLFPELAKQNGAALIPFLLEGVGGVPELNLPDGIHPTAEGHKKVAENVWRVLRPTLLAR